VSKGIPGRWKHRQHLEEEIAQRTADLLESNTQLGEELADRKAAEQKLKESNEQLSILVDSLPIAVYRCRADDFAVMYISHNVLSFTGYEPKDFIENTDLWFTRIHPDDASRVSDEITLLSGEKILTFEH
jgi:PAS domain-containing protein